MVRLDEAERRSGIDTRDGLRRIRSSAFAFLILFHTAQSEQVPKRRPLPFINFGWGAQVYLYETFPSVRPAIGFFEASLYVMDSSFASEAFHRNRGGSIGLLFGDGRFGAYYEKDLIFPQRLHPGTWPILYHGWAYGSGALLDYRKLSGSYASPWLKYWVSVFGMVNAFGKAELVNLYSPKFSVGAYFKIPFPLFI